MKKQQLILLTFLVAMAALVIWNNNRITSTQLTITAPSTPTTGAEPPQGCIPTFVDGGGPYYLANAPFRENIAPEENNGEMLIVSGKILRSDCKTPIANAVLDIWQANESGNYDDEWYRGKVTARDDGTYTFSTVVPKGYGEGTGYRPPHIHFKVFENTTELITSQMFLPAARAQKIEDAYIVSLETKDVAGQKTHYASHDIIVP